MELPQVSGKRIVLAVCGGIAAYKVVEAARELTQAGADVRVVMTEAATHFVGPITFSTLTGNPVTTDLFPEDSPAEIPHTSMARSANLVLVAPATAKVIAKLALGISDDLTSALLLSFTGPVVMAPAMHTEMWENEATVTNVDLLRSRGVRFVGPVEGALAGPDTGMGRLAEVETILEAVDEELARTESLSGVRVLVTAGGTREPIDAVRFIGNRSSGRMGFEIAREAQARGAKVVLVTGPTHLTPPAGAEVFPVTTTAEMKEAVLSQALESRVIVMAAAVADWKPQRSSTKKLKKEAGAPEIRLEATDDILEQLGVRRPEGQVLVGFAAETEDLEENTRRKLKSKNLDLAVGNLVGVEDSGFDVETNRAVAIDRLGNEEPLPLMSKRELAKTILDAVSDRFL